MAFDTKRDYETLKSDLFRFIWDELAPYEERIEASGHVPVKELLPKLAKEGLFALLVPKEYGGIGLTIAQYVPILAEISKIHGGIRLIVHVHNSSVHCVLAGTEAQKAEFLPKMAKGELFIAFALTEPDGGSGRDTRTTAERRGDHFVLNGRKHLITNSDIAQLFMVICYTNRELGDRGLSSLLVERGTSGFDIRPMPPLMGCRGSYHGLLTFKDCPVPVKNILGEEGQGLSQAMNALEISRVLIAATSLGTAERCLDLSVAFAKKRETFGKPIAERQAIQGYLADMATDIYALRNMIDDAASKFDRGIPIPAEASMCKLFGLEAVGRVTDKALLVFGGIGYTRAYPIERLYRDARCNWLEEGTPTIQRLVIARTLLKG